jgi:hypothetical protein
VGLRATSSKPSGDPGLRSSGEFRLIVRFPADAAFIVEIKG